MAGFDWRTEVEPIMAGFDWWIEVEPQFFHAVSTNSNKDTWEEQGPLKKKLKQFSYFSIYLYFL
jgi:hypothetical protein